MLYSYIPLVDGRTMRIVIPGPETPSLSFPFHLVGFFGLRPQLQRRGDNDLSVSALCHDVDDALSEGVDAELVSLYMSVERSPGGPCYNLVVFREGRSADDWGPKAGHSHAVAKNSVSPYFYSEVRIHRAW